MIESKFLELFRNRRWFLKQSKKTRKWSTHKHHDLSDLEIWAALRGETRTVLGCRWAAESRYAVLDIDQKGYYHDLDSLYRIKSALSEIGIDKTFLYRSSDSGGWHLYIFFDELVGCRVLERSLKSWLELKGFRFSLGNLECFPSTSGLRMPLQAGFEWLDEFANPIKLKRPIIEQFVLDSEQTNSWKGVSEAIKAQSPKPTTPTPVPFWKTDPGKPRKTDRYQLGKQYWENGLTGPGQRHEAILAVGYYLWFAYDLPGVWNAQRRYDLIVEWLENSHNGHSTTVNRNDWDSITRDIRSACFWARTEAPVSENQAPAPASEWDQTCRLANRRRVIEARQKILSVLKENPTASQADIVRLTGCSVNTVRKHRDLRNQQPTT